MSAWRVAVSNAIGISPNSNGLQPKSVLATSSNALATSSVLATSSDALVTNSNGLQPKSNVALFGVP